MDKIAIALSLVILIEVTILYSRQQKQHNREIDDLHIMLMSINDELESMLKSTKK